MKRIYESAQVVISWLGPGSPTSGVAWEMIKSIGLWRYEETLAGRHWEAGRPILAEDLDALGVGLDAEKWRAWEEFFDRPYFTRQWVCQEISHDRNVVMLVGGSEPLGVRVIAMAVGWLMMGGLVVHRATGISFLGTQKATRMFLKTGTRPGGRLYPILDLLNAFRNLGATEKKDKIYALLGMAEETNGIYGGVPLVVEPDYRQSTTFIQVYTTFARDLIQHMKDLALLSSVQHPDDDDGRDQFVHDGLYVPSWVPRWDQPKLTRHFSNGFTRLYGERTAHLDYRASSTRQMMLGSPPDEDTLCLRGLQVDVVTECSEETDRTPDTWPRENLQSLLDLVTTRLAGSGWSPYPTGEDPLLAFALTLVNGRRVDATFYTEDRDKLALLKNFLAFLHTSVDQASNVELLTRLRSTIDHMSAGLPTDYTPDTPDADIFFASTGDCKHRKFLITRKGHFVLAPAASAVGDVIVVLFGAAVPFVLRPRPGGKGYWLVGECYTHGIMHGELLNASGIEEATVNEEVFEIH